MAVRTGEWLGIIEQEYLRRFIPGGGSAIKFVIGDDAAMISDVQRRLTELAVGRGFDVVKLDTAATKLHMIHDVFFAIARCIDWDSLAQRWVEKVFKSNDYEWPQPGEAVPLQELSSVNKIAEPLLRKQVQQWLTAGIMHDREMAQDFRTAMTHLCMRRMEWADERRVAPVIEWLRGELRLIIAVRDVPINARITRHNGRAMLQSLCRWLSLTDRPGLSLAIDLRQVGQTGPATAERLRYTPAAALDVFEVLRQLIDDVESLKGLFIAILADPAFENDPKRGMPAYTALKERIWPDVHPRGRDNPLAPLLTLATGEVEGTHRNSEELPFCEERVAVEALRVGVPNSAAIRLLGSSEQQLIRRFGERLDQCRSEPDTGKAIEGEIIAGGFGSGKSHLLGFLAETALRENFIVSRVAISKETPLFHPDRLFAALVRNATVPGQNDDVMTAVMSRLNHRSGAFEKLESWASTPQSGLSPLFPALLYLIPKQITTAQDLADIGRFFGGAKLSVSKVRQWLRAVGAAKLFDIKPVKVAELALQRIWFASRLFRAAGFNGWCVLLDEVELIGRYSVLQRGKSYAELTRWLGLAQDTNIPGIVSICAITDDFKDAILIGKLDIEKVPRVLEAKGLERQARLAETAMNTIEGKQYFLTSPDKERLRNGVDTVAQLYEQAYRWTPLSVEIGEHLSGKTMRQYIKSWITGWDIQRLYMETEEVTTEMHAPDYSENADFEVAPEPENEGGAGA